MVVLDQTSPVAHRALAPWDPRNFPTRQWDLPSQPHGLPLVLQRGLQSLDQEVGVGFPEKVGTFGTCLSEEYMPFWWVVHRSLVNFNKKHSSYKFCRIIEYTFLVLQKRKTCPYYFLSYRRVELTRLKCWQQWENPCSCPPAIIVLLACKAHIEFAVHSSPALGERPRCEHNWLSSFF